MATTDNYRIRFMENNFARLISASIEKTSELASFPVTNAVSNFRSRVWKPSGAFTVSDSAAVTGVAPNNKIYINDGADKTITLTAAVYTTPALFATHVQTQLNASSSGWTVSYDSAGETYKFTISNSGSVTLKLSTTTDSAWDMMGFTLASDQTGTSFVAQEQRNHYPSERVTFDLGANTAMTAFMVIGPLDEIFSITSTTSVTLQASNLNQWENPPLEISLTPTDKGIFKFFDDISDTAYRFWRLVISDIASPHPDGPSGISIGNIYLGDYITLTNRNMKRGFERTDVDPSRVDESESGALHFDSKTKYRIISQASIQYLDRDDKDTLSSMFEKLGKTTPFYVSVDPRLCFTDELSELTLYVVFNDEPKLKHVFNDVFTMSFSLREVV